MLASAAVRWEPGRVGGRPAALQPAPDSPFRNCSRRNPHSGHGTHWGSRRYHCCTNIFSRDAGLTPFLKSLFRVRKFVKFSLHNARTGGQGRLSSRQVCAWIVSANQKLRAALRVTPFLSPQQGAGVSGVIAFLVDQVGELLGIRLASPLTPIGNRAPMS